MATVQQLKERATQLLPPGSEVSQAFICQTAASFALCVINWMTGLTLGWITYRCVAFTQDAVYVLDAPRLSGGANPRSVVARLPRHTQLGPVQLHGLCHVPFAFVCARMSATARACPVNGFGAGRGARS